MDTLLKSETHVLIVGAGPVGLTLGCELLRHSVACCVIEKYDEFPITSQALGFHSRTMDVFQFMGIVDAILANSIVDMAVTVREWNRVLLSLKLDLPHCPDQPYRGGAWVLNRAVTEWFLRDRLDLGGAVERSSEFVTFHEAADGTVATIKHRHTDVPRETSINAPAQVWSWQLPGGHVAGIQCIGASESMKAPSATVRGRCGPVRQQPHLD